MATPIFLTRTVTEHTHPGGDPRETQDQPRAVGGEGGAGLCVALAALGRTRGTACSAAGTRSDAAMHRGGPGLDSTAKTATVSSEPMVTLVMVTKSLGSASLTISSHLRPKAMRVSVSAGRAGRDACQQRSLGECRSGRWGYYSLAEGGGCGPRLQ